MGLISNLLAGYGIDRDHAANDVTYTLSVFALAAIPLAFSRFSPSGTSHVGMRRTNLYP
jgi:hypothetical protein